MLKGQFALLVIGIGWLGLAEPVRAESVTPPPEPTATIPAQPIDLSQLPRPATTVQEWQAQLDAATVSVTGVQVKPTGSELEIILETAAGKRLTIDASKFRAEGNTLIAEIANASLALPSGQAFSADNPTADIAAVQVNQLAPGTIRVSVVGKEALPKTQVTLKNGGLAYALNPGKADEDQEVVVTNQRPGYRAPNATTGTKTDTPLRDIPGSIQVIPRQVLQDQGVTTLSDALRNTSGVVPQREFSNNTDSRFTIRGFANESANLRNGFRLVNPQIAPSNIERIETLKGPVSVLYGQFEPGGVINFVTRQPQPNPSLQADLTIGQFNFYEPSLDLTGPLTPDKKLLYRFNVAYRNAGNFRDFVEGSQISIAPTLQYNITANTSLTFGYEYFYSRQTFDDGLPIDPVSLNLPIQRFLGGASDSYRNSTHNITLTFAHRFNDNVSLRSGFNASINRSFVQAFRLSEYDPTTGNIDRFYTLDDRPTRQDTFSWQTDLTLKFRTGFVRHQLLMGFDLAREINLNAASQADTGFLINVFNPVYDTPIPPRTSNFSSERITDTLGFYVQDQITLRSNLKLLIGGRFDITSFQNRFFEFFEGETSSVDERFSAKAFSPRVGLVYQPIQPVSLYASYSRSFVPNNASARGGAVIEPTRGTQYEVGIKAELRNFALTLAAYQIDKTNILTADPTDPDFVIAVGSARSRGLELDISGELRPGWNVIASAFVNNTVITEDNDLPVGNRLINAPNYGASFWTTYTLQSGAAKGLGFGAGIFYTGNREAELPNNFVLPGFVRADAAIFYRRDRWRLGVNIKNLFNTRYLESSQNSRLVYPGAPLTVQGTVSFTF
jgi:iron complex outermembrane recepter protein